MDKKTITPLAKTSSAKAKTMNFPDAMRQILHEKRVRRVSWGSANDYCLLKDGWLTVFTKGAFHTWHVSDGDMEGEDWVILTESN